MIVSLFSGIIFMKFKITFMCIHPDFSGTNKIRDNINILSRECSIQFFLLVNLAQSAGSVEYTDSTSAER